MSLGRPHATQLQLSAVVVTATIGEPTLSDAVASVQAQTHAWTRHLIVVDGADHEHSVRAQLAEVDTSQHPVAVLVLPEGTGHRGHYGHRIYGAAGLLVHDDLVFLLDGDNVVDERHVETCVEALAQTGASWAYTLRRIVDRDGQFYCADDGDSLGFWPRYRTFYLGRNVLFPGEEEFLLSCPYLIDTSCYALRREVLVRWSRCWDYGWGADCIFATDLIRHEFGVGTGQRTVAYRLDVSAFPEIAEYFVIGNELALEQYGESFPWVGTEPGCVVRAPVPRLQRFGNREGDP